MAAPLAIDLFCGHCGTALVNCRPDKRFCSTRCSQRARYGAPKMPFRRACRVCDVLFDVSVKADANRKYCSQACAKRAYSSGSTKRKFASAMIAKIPLPLSQWIARAYLPTRSEAA